MNNISNSDNVIDSRDVEKRLDELTAEQAALLDALDEARTASEEAQREGRDDLHAEEVTAAQAALDAWNGSDDTGGELARLTALRDQAEGYAPDWRYGCTLIRDSYFKDYAQELAEDRDMPKDVRWPYNCLDWDQAARELQQDYTAVEYGGVTYWVR
jgi:multidrug efflux pump subunit AcrA (membrane-fusion protein)